MKKLLPCIVFLFTHQWPAMFSGAEETECTMPAAEISFTIRKDNVVDLTYSFNDDSAYWFDNPSGFHLTEVFKGFITGTSRFFYSTFMYSQPEHAGTHMDAPVHFSESGVGAEAVSVHDLIGPGVLLNLKKHGDMFGADSTVKIEHFKEWERNTGETIPTGSIVLIRTGFGDLYHDRPEYLGTDKTGEDALTELHFPGLDHNAAEWLVNKRCIAAVGIDTASIDRGAETENWAHRVLCANGIPIFENVGYLDKLAEQEKPFKIIALPQKIEGGSGAPVRIVAVTD